MSATVISRDGTRIVLDVHGDGPITYVIAHGITGRRTKEGVVRVIGWLQKHGRVIVFDQRGHGDSGGTCTLGYREPMDVDAVISWARAQWDAPVVTIGFSMGAAVAIRHAALTTPPPLVRPVDAGIVVSQRPDATVVVSGVGHWYFRGTDIMDRLFKLTATAWGRVAMRVKERVRLSVRDWPGPGVDHALQPLDPTGCSAVIRHPLLIVNGDHDHYFPAEHGRMMFDAAVDNPSAAFWLEEGMGHAERATTEELIDRIAEWASVQVRR